MAQWSSWQTEIRQREESILSAARAVLLERGYFGLTMERVASVSACPKGTMYQHFGCKEDLLVALAVACAGARLEMMERAAAHSCPSRERVVALGEAVALSALGGLLGLLLGFGLAQAIHFALPALPVHTPLSFVLLAEAVAVAIGLAAGVLPARRAARLDPVEALRTE